MASIIYQHESAIGICVALPSEHPSRLLPHLILPSCHRELLLGSLIHTLNSHWLSVLHMVCKCFKGIISDHPILPFSHCVQKFDLYVCVSFAVL